MNGEEALMKQIRQTKTKDELKMALTQLLAEKDFEAITVSDITRQAGINRGTFYLHYKDKMDFIDQMVQALFDQVMAQLPFGRSQDQWLNPIVAVMTLVKEDFAFIYAITTSRPAYLTGILRAFLDQIIDRMPDLQARLSHQAHLPEDYAREVFYASCSSIILHWIQKGAQESPEQVALMFLHNF